VIQKQVRKFCILDQRRQESVDKKHTTEQIISKLRETEALQANGKAILATNKITKEAMCGTISPSSKPIRQMEHYRVELLEVLMILVPFQLGYLSR
jgi:hypothetical protein